MAIGGLIGASTTLEDGRLVLVLSPVSFNKGVGVLICCAITTSPKKNPFEVPITIRRWPRAAALADHVVTIDWKARKGRVQETVSDEMVRRVVGLFAPVVGISA